MECPTYLSEFAQEIWPEVLDELDRRGRRLLVHHQQVVMFCQCISFYRDATIELIKDGLVGEEDFMRGEVEMTRKKVQPAFQVYAELVKQAERLIKEMGLNEPLEEETADAATGLRSWLERAVSSVETGKRKRPARNPPAKGKRR